MNQVQNEMLKKIYCNFEELNGDYNVLPEVVQADKQINEYMLKKYSKEDVIDLEACISNVSMQYEKQGFIYGFKYAVALLVGGKE